MAAKPEAPKASELVLKDRAHLRLTGVQEVVRADEDTLVLDTAQGRLTVCGSGLRIIRFAQDAGELEAEGRADSLEYGGEAGFWARLFG